LIECHGLVLIFVFLVDDPIPTNADRSHTSQDRTLLLESSPVGLDLPKGRV
jgi:hypothetical protein